MNATFILTVVLFHYSIFNQNQHKEGDLSLYLLLLRKNNKNSR